MVEGLAGRLQHPRRSLGDRHRSQALKFLRLSEVDVERDSENTRWAEQNARQALLHDFTHPDNWRVLANIKVQLCDETGLRALLSDLFSVLGRDPEQVTQLEGVSILDVGIELLEAALTTDHLDPDIWFNSMGEDGVILFASRVEILDLTDPRCNVLFGRRIERMWGLENTELCMKLSRILLSNRPQNFELWLDLARAHERLGSFDEAWLCYDQAQTYAPHLDVRDAFRKRMEAQLDTTERLPWKKPSVEVRDDFLHRMQKLASTYSTDIQDTNLNSDQVEESVNEDEDHLISLLKEGNYSAAFFLARRIVTRGEDWADSYLKEAKIGLENRDNVEIP